MLGGPSMTKLPHVSVLTACASLLIASHARAQSAPTGAHPRIVLDAATRNGLRAQASDPKSPIARASKRCSAARTDPGSYSERDWQGFEFTTTLSSCLA